MTRAKVVLIGCVAFFLTFIWWPIFQTFWLSFQFKRPGEQYWVGLENYRTILFADPVFWKSLQVTFTYVLLTVPGVVIFGLLLAVTLNAITNVTVRGFFTSLYFVPYIVPLVGIIESLQLKEGDARQVFEHGEVFHFRGDYLPVIRLHEVFGVEPRSHKLTDGLLMVVEGDGRRAGLERVPVDLVDAQHDRPLVKALGHIDVDGLR